MSTETIRTIRDGEPWTATATFTQLLSSEDTTSSTLLYVHRDHEDYQGRGALDGNLDYVSFTTSGVCRHKAAEALGGEAGRVGIGANTPYLSSGPARRSILDLTSLRTRQLEARERCDYI